MCVIISVKIVPFRDKYVIKDDGPSGDYFYTRNGTIRMFRRPSEAVYWLKQVCNRFRDLGYVISLPDGTLRNVGITPGDVALYGPHRWKRANLVINPDGTDTYECEYCGELLAGCFGLTKPPQESGICRKNLRGEKV